MWTQFRTSRNLALVACAIAAMQLGCSKKKDSAEPAPTAAPKETVNANLDSSLLTELREAAVDCQEVEKQQRINCSGAKKNTLVLAFNRGDRKRIESLPTFAAALADKDKKVQAVASAVLYGAFRLGLGKEATVGSVKAEEAKALLTAALNLPASSAMQAIPAATHAAMLSGQKDVLFSKLGKDTPLQVRTMAYRYLMVYGRLSVFEDVKASGQDPSAAVVLAAIESPRNMKDWTSEEQDAICPWAAGFLDDKRAPVAGNATAVLSHCTGAHLDALLDRIDQILKAGTFSFIHSTALRDMCRKSTPASGGSGSDAQCERVRKLQESVVNSDKLQARVRAMTLTSLAHRWPDKQTMTLAKKYEKSKEVELQKAAEQSIRRLDDRLRRSTSDAKKPGTTVNKPATTLKTPAPAVKTPAPAPAN